MTIHLGYEVETGASVDIPLDHLAVTGRTQESGKTTTLQALITRSGLRALAFITKRGEKSFQNARRIPAYFKEKTDWRSVDAILSASVGEKLKWERSSIMWLCENHHGGRGKKTYQWPAPKTLKDVLSNCDVALENATSGFNKSIYTVLREYLRIVVPQVATVPATPGIDLQPGINVMDLRDYSFEMQALIIRSGIEWVTDREEKTITIIPEAWEFIPQDRSSPVLLACETLGRQGAGIQNYIWLDSQDLAAIHKKVLKNCGVYILGVQREKNEVDRVLDHIPEGFPRLKRRDIQSLGIGQFYVCYGRETKLVYVQPSWSDETESRDHALYGGPLPKAPKHVKEPEEDSMWREKFEAECERTAKLERQVNDLQEQINTLRSRSPVILGGAMVNGKAVNPQGDGTFIIHEASSAPNPESLTPNPSDLNGFYAAFKARLLTDHQVVIALGAARPEIEVTVERQKLVMDAKTLPGQIARMLADGFFGQARTGGEVNAELKRRGTPTAAANVYPPLKKLASQGFLTVENGTYIAVPGMVVRVKQTTEL